MFKGRLSSVSYPLLAIALICISLILSCGGSDGEEIPPIEQDEALVGYLNRFAREAEERGITIDFTNTEAVFVDRIRINNRPFCGRGFFNFEGTGKNRIEISREQGCWNGREDIEKENLFFHEIGHAYFGRGHIEETLNNGVVKSIMCSVNCSNYDTYTRATIHRRPYYIDELIDETTPEPDWGKAKSNFREFWADDISPASELVFMSDSPFITGSIDDNSQVNGTYSLRMQAAERDPDNFAFWQLTFDQPDIPLSATVKLSAVVNSVGPVLGRGLSLVIRTTDGFNLIQFSGTEGEETINGIMENRKIEVELIDYLPTGEILTIFVVWLDDTSGEVYIDDLKLEIAED